MAFWVGLWKVCLIGSVGLFAGMAVWVTIGGAIEVRRMLKRLESMDEGDEGQPEV
jgi:hypothetical protein